MLFNLAKVFVAFTLAAVVSAHRSTPHDHLKRQDVDNSALCSLVLKPSVVVASTENLDAEFNYVIGFALSIDAGENIFQYGSNFTANESGTFNIDERISAGSKTPAQVAAIITGWLGESKEGFLASWLVESVTCAQISA